MNICIIGLGLIGGSLALALKKAYPDYIIYGISDKQSDIDTAIAKGYITSGSLEYSQIIPISDIIFIETPLGTIVDVAHKIIPYLKEGAIVTDGGSCKSIVYDIEPKMPTGTYFIGAHPMAGTEDQGIDAVVDGLFDNAAYIHTPTMHTNTDALDTLKSLLTPLQVRFYELNPVEHDKVVALISHLPIIAAAAITNIADDADSQNTLISRLVAGGFRDTTRVASGNITLGLDILLQNKKNIIQYIDNLIMKLSDYRRLLQNSDRETLEYELKKAKEFRDGIYKK